MSKSVTVITTPNVDLNKGLHKTLTIICTSNAYINKGLTATITVLSTPNTAYLKKRQCAVKTAPLISLSEKKGKSLVVGALPDTVLTRQAQFKRHLVNTVEPTTGTSYIYNNHVAFSKFYLR